MRRVLTSAVAAMAVVSLALPAVADMLILKDNNIIELTDVKRVKKSAGGAGNIWVYEGKNESGKTEIIAERDVVSGGYIPGKTSWQLRKEHRDWYEKESPKVPEDDFKAQATFARKCNEPKMNHDLDEEADKHFRKAYELELQLVNKSEEKALELFAKRVRDSYELYEEALTIFRLLMNLKKEQLIAKGATPEGYVSLGKQAKDLELWPEAGQFFEEAVKLNDKHPDAKKQLKELRKEMEVPLNMPMYRALNVPFASGIRYMKSKQTKEGWFGGDFTEAGVHGRRGISGVCTMALFAEYQLEKRRGIDKDKAVEMSKPFSDALEFLMKGEEGIGKEGRLEGDDMWGAIFATEALVMAATDDYIMNKYGDTLKTAIHTHVERLKKLQRSDGGWYYYNFTATSSSFSTASTLIILETLKNMGAEIELCDSMIPGAVKCIQSLKQGRGTYKYMEMGSGYHSASSPLGASARSPLCEFGLYCAEGSDPLDYRQAVMNWLNNVHLLKKVKGREGTHIGKAMTAPYYFLYSHMYMARAVKAFPKGQARGMLRTIASLMLSYQEPDGAWTDWKLPTDDIHKFRVSQTGLGLVTLWHLMTGDRDPAVAPLRGGGLAPGTTGTPTESGSGDKKDAPKENDPPKEEPKNAPEGPRSAPFGFDAVLLP